MPNPNGSFTLHDGPPYANGSLHMGDGLEGEIDTVISLILAVQSSAVDESTEITSERKRYPSSESERTTSAHHPNWKDPRCDARPCSEQDPERHHQQVQSCPAPQGTSGHLRYLMAAHPCRWHQVASGGIRWHQVESGGILARGMCEMDLAWHSLQEFKGASQPSSC